MGVCRTLRSCDMSAESNKNDKGSIVVRAMPFGSPEQQQSIQLRYQVLREPLGLQFDPAQLAQEDTHIHLGAFVGDTLCGCLVLEAHPIAHEMKMRQVAVHPDWQGQGVGRELVEHSQQLALYSHLALYCHARATAAPFYTRLNWRQEGEGFEEVGLPHFLMHAPPPAPLP